MTLAIAGMGTAVPECRVPQEDACAVAKILSGEEGSAQSMLGELYGHTEIATRHMVIGQRVVDDILGDRFDCDSPFSSERGPGKRGPRTAQRMESYRRAAAPLAEKAARQAVSESGLEAADITHLVTVSCTGFSAPGVDFALIERLGLARSVQRTHVGFMGCHGAINGLRVANAFTGADARARVLLCPVELCSLHYFYGWDPKRMVANALFADGAAALVGVPAKERDAWRVQALGSHLFPDSARAMTWEIGDHGFEMTLSTKVPALLAEHLQPWMRAWLAEHGLQIEDVPIWAIHPGGPRILDVVQENLGLRADKCATSREVFRECGNMSSPTVLFILDRLRTEGAPLPCVALAFGPGLVAEAALFV